jgi:hypothetical protein
MYVIYLLKFQESYENKEWNQAYGKEFFYKQKVESYKNLTLVL